MYSASYLQNDVHGEDRLIESHPLFAIMDGVSLGFGWRAAPELQGRLEAAVLTRAGVRDAIAGAHAALKTFADYQGAQTTLAGVLYEAGGAYSFSVGDSLTFLVHDDGLERVHPYDHHPAGAGLEQAIGWRYSLHEEYLPLDARILLMSDGVSDNLSDEVLYSLCTPSASQTRDGIVSALEDARKKNRGCAYRGFRPDDCALIVAGFAEE